MVASSKSLTPEDLDRPEWNSLLNNYSKHDIGEAYFQGRVEQIGLHVEHWGIDKRHHDESLIFDNKMDLRLWEPLDGQEERAATWPEDNFTDKIWYAETSGLTIPEVAPEAGSSFGTSVPTYDDRRWELRGVADVKTKANPDWLGKFNLRHMAHYAEWADRFNVPVFLYMTMVEPEKQSVGEQSFLTPIPSDWEWERLIDHYDSSSYTDYSYGELKDVARTCSAVHRTFRAPDGNLVVEIADDYRRNWDYFVEGVL